MTDSTNKDHWSSSAYQHSASFVPKLATKVVQWLDLQKDDVLLDVGCGDGVLDVEFANILAQGSGSLHGTDASSSMIDAARQACKDAPNATFQVIDSTTPNAYQRETYTKVFSNAALHWILSAPSTRTSTFQSMYDALQPGGSLILEMGGQGNVCEMRTAIVSALARRMPMEKIIAAEPWFFPNESWLQRTLESVGFVVERCEREWRPTTADRGGVEGWVRLMGGQWLDVLEDEQQREEVIKECAQVLRHVCGGEGGDGEDMISYVRLRAVAKKPAA